MSNLTGQKTIKLTAKEKKRNGENIKIQRNDNPCV